MAVRRQNKRRNNKSKKSKPKTKVDKSLSRRITKLEKSPESKYLDYVATGAPTTSGVAYSLISHMDDGPDYNERIGNKITAKRVYLQYRVVFSTLTAWQLRVIVGWDKQANGQAGLQLFTGTSPTTQELSQALLDDRAGMVTINAPYNQNTKDRYKILHDRTFNINPDSAALPDDYVINIKKMINLNNAVVMYSEGTATIDALPSRNLFVAYYYSLSTDNTVQMNFASRFFYTDE